MTDQGTMVKPQPYIEREECPNGCAIHPAWAFCAECGAEFVMVRYLRAWWFSLASDEERSK